MAKDGSRITTERRAVPGFPAFTSRNSFTKTVILKGTVTHVHFASSAGVFHFIKPFPAERAAELREPDAFPEKLKEAKALGVPGRLSPPHLLQDFLDSSLRDLWGPQDLRTLMPSPPHPRAPFTLTLAVLMPTPPEAVLR